MIVDETPENIAVLVEALADNNILVALNGEKALSILASETSVDLILLDIVMPGMNGFEVAERIKAEKHTSGIPIVFITGEKDVVSFIHGFNLGAEDYLTKPFEIGTVQSEVQSIFRKQQTIL